MSDQIYELLELGFQAFDQGDFRRAAGYYEGAADLARQEGNTSAELHGWDMTARSWNNAGEIQKSIEAATRLLARARELDNKSYQMDAARLLASRMADLDVRNHWHEIRPLLLEGLDIARQLGEQKEVVEHLARLGECAVGVGELEEGMEWLQQALNEAENLADKKHRAFYRFLIHGELSNLMRKRDNPEEAVRHAEIALGAAREHGNPSLIADALLTLAQVEQARGDLAEALRLVEEVLPQAQQMGWKGTERWAEYLRGELLREMGRTDEAELPARRALGLAREMKVKEEEVECFLSLGQTLLELKRYPEAHKMLWEARRLAQGRDYADHFKKAEELLNETALHWRESSEEQRS